MVLVEKNKHSSAADTFQEVEKSMSSKTCKTVSRQNEIARKAPKPADWNFSRLLLYIARNLSDKELSNLKQMAVGNGLLHENQVEKLTSCMDLFSALRSMQYMDSKNMTCLQQMLMLIERKDLILKAIEYCQKEEDGEMARMLKASDEDLEYGHSYARFHFDNLESIDCNVNFISYFKMRISSLLFVPPDHVIVSGVEETCENEEKTLNPYLGIIITLMIPDMFISILQTMLEDGKRMSAIRLFGVKEVVIQNKTYSLTEGSVHRRHFGPHELHTDLIHEKLLDRERKPELWDRQLENKDNFSNNGHLDNTFNEKLSRINQKSGMSITLWKNFGIVNEKSTKPQTSHDELQRQCLYAKVTRLYPQLTYEQTPKQKEKQNNGNTEQ
ncbi:uncharacterized protein LOC123552225 isoform X2 [Mercenaria mercenaria]|uniref:uncharacterized protein LOC123552225 isoform X2 n=1 Tax=Mercenaria mercenaria TaxID=6596 RepID=UPI00234F3DE5|nr:uncharacterized protein LOC123552225 isoform X2 [Mercenaria mercenaria]XP_053397719.1 uncharacterized protein LOC123552225 isoform X2 [Mercenaria mercenaria]